MNTILWLYELSETCTSPQVAISTQTVTRVITEATLKLNSAIRVHNYYPIFAKPIFHVQICYNCPIFLRPKEHKSYLYKQFVIIFIEI